MVRNVNLSVERRCRSSVEEFDDGCDQCIIVLAILWFHPPSDMIGPESAQRREIFKHVDKVTSTILTSDIIKASQLSSLN
jgi:hypothetical protein